MVGVFQKGTPELATQAVEAAFEAFQRWERVPGTWRAEILIRAGSLLRELKFEMAAWMVFEVGKNWGEADADVAEAIDFCDFYGGEMLRLAGPQPLAPVAGEANELRYVPLGVGAVIPPWNFPLAILAGMTTASWVTGNTVVLKPSSDSPTVGAQFMAILEEAGLPGGVVNFLTGSGGTVGNALVTHPKTRFVAFTGSKEVGLNINELAAKTPPGQIWIKRVVAEMGGKDSIVVGLGGGSRRCRGGGVCFRLRVPGAKMFGLLACHRGRGYLRCVPRKTSGPHGEGADRGPGRSRRLYWPGNQRNRDALDLNYIEVGKKEGGLIAGGKEAGGDGYFIQPTILADIPPKARVSQEEIFGPVLAVLKARDFDDALSIANNTEYGLTGAVYSNSREHLEDARARFHVGNLYFNRKCTGAFVGGHPFGGFNMSGTDSKAGGRDYLLLFTQAKVISEKVPAAG